MNKVSLQSVVESALRLQSGESPFITRRGDAQGRVVSILDEFSQSCFSPVLNLFSLGPAKFELDLDRIDPEFLLVESAWNGNEGRWRYQLTSSTGPKQAFTDLLRECRRRGIPTVFWNKEDPVHYADFIEAAKLFDFVLTTDGDKVPDYQRDLGHGRVDIMRFAAEPTIHNPLAVDGYRRGDIAFGGQYFKHKYPERRAQMDLLFSAAANFDFSIFSRMLGADENYQFPGRYQQFVKGSLPYREMVREYKRHKVFLNVNSVVGSSTMCARRIYELAACKTVTVSTPSAATRSVFAEDEVPFVESAGEAGELFERLVGDDVWRCATAQRAWRRVARAHTMADRAAQIREMLGHGAGRVARKYRMHVRKRDWGQELLLAMESQSVLHDGATIEVVLHGEGEGASLGGARSVSVVAANHAGGCVSDADYVGVLSGDLVYGRHYLEDMALSIERFVPGRTVTKLPFESKSFDPASFECFVDRVRPGSWLAAGELADLDQLTRADLASGAGDEWVASPGAYLTDPFNLRLMRGAPEPNWEA